MCLTSTPPADHATARRGISGVPSPEALSQAVRHWGRDDADGVSAYAPQMLPCPSDGPLIRQATSLSEEEANWLLQRRNNTVAPMRGFLRRLNLTGLDVESYFNGISEDATLLPNIGMAFSGGGYRALMNGAGALAAFDNRTAESLKPGHLGGLLQASTYVSGLSGGSWLVGSYFLNGFKSVQDILGESVNDGALWQFDMPITKGPLEGMSETAEYLTGILDDTRAKHEAGFNTSLTDVWGRALSFQLVSPADGGPSSRFSSIKSNDMFAAGGIPMPIIVADGRNPDELSVGGNATVYEINPWEFGTFDPTAFAFAPLEYLGTSYSEGKPNPAGRCVKGFDNSGYIMGTSSTLFNQGLLQMEGSDGLTAKLVKPLLEDVDEEQSEYM